MTVSNHQQIKNLIEDTTIAFENCGGVNTDYADFATMALADFKKLLGDAKLTDRQLKQLIRKANCSHRDGDPQGCWASFVAKSIAKQSNSNLQNA